MKLSTKIHCALLLLALATHLRAQDCKDRVPRFELVLREVERGVFYEEEPIVAEVWVVHVCSEIMPRVDYASFFLRRECVSWVPDCTKYRIFGSCCSFYNPELRGGLCTGAGGCDNELNESSAGLMANHQLCDEIVPVSPDGRAFLGLVDMTYSGALEGITVELLTAGTRKGQGPCGFLGPQAFIELRNPGSDPSRLQVADSDPIEIRVMREPFIRGDANQDQVVDLSDPVRILNILFLGKPSTIFGCANAADVDDNNQHEITDAVALLRFLFNNGAPPVAPYPEAGYDKTPRFPEGELDSGCTPFL